APAPAPGPEPKPVDPTLCLVHNGSFANHATIRRRLADEGVTTETDNDSEVAARYLAARLAAGDDLAAALRRLTATFDGFFTLAVTTADSFAVVRDRIACKPAIIAETDQWVAMVSEYRALLGLPGLADAAVFEPEPAEVYLWAS
ncbi:glutamine amidotransferase, partial [Frankia sp. AiPs1]|nr:glutamine amidotransferase [Frankia sp. AiPs1]